MSDLPKNKRGSNKVVKDDQPAEVRKNEGVKEPFKIVSITGDRNGNIIGLGNDGGVYIHFNGVWTKYE